MPNNDLNILTANELELEFDPLYIGVPYSPKVDITETVSEITVTITDATGEHSYEVPKTQGAIADAEAATSAANAAATDANNAASAANTAAQSVNEAKAAAVEAASAANSAAENANAKATLANNAASAANTAAENANTKAGLANSAATAANNAASDANAKATLADTAATNANNKATLANTAAGNADAKAILANDAATLANTKAGLADTAATAANSAAANADAKATAANTAAANADAKAGIAVDAATLANTAAANATDKATLAGAAANNADAKATLANNAASNADAKAELANNAATAANGAATAANEAATAANNSADNADAKATLANSAATAANAAAGDASTAATGANAAATNANDKAILANSAASNANEKADLANTKAALADAAATAANTAASNANDEAAGANSAANTANTASVIANSAATNADEKAALANSAAFSATNAANAANDATETAIACIEAMGDISELAVPLMSDVIRGGAMLSSDFETANGKLILAESASRYLPSVVVGGADNLTGRNIEVAEFVNRVSGAQDKTISTIESIKGNTVVWNQLAPTSYPSSAVTFNSSVKTYLNHKYLFACEATPPSSDSGTVRLFGRGTGSNVTFATLTYTTNTQAAQIFTMTIDGLTGGGHDAAGYVWAYYQSAVSPIDKMVLIDLTRMFGAGNEPATVAEFESMFPADYYPYDAGSLLSVNITGIETTDANGDDLDELEIPVSEYFPTGMKSAGTAYDELQRDKAVTRIGSRAYESGDESDSSVITDGTTTYYELATPTTTTIDPPLNLVYEVENGGTESIIIDTTQTAPQSAPIIIEYAYGETPNSIRDNALSCIAAVENGIASTNYAIGAYLVHLGRLYKVTSAIASGEAIVPGTNVTQTTVMAELIALTS